MRFYSCQALAHLLLLYLALPDVGHFVHVMHAISTSALECTNFARHARHLCTLFNGQNVHGMHSTFHPLKIDRYCKSYSIKVHLYHFFVATQNVYLVQVRH